jgi:RNA polymerase sigma factor (sigma-70 family)
VGSGALWEQRVAAWEQSAEGETLSRSVMELIDAMRTGQTQSSIPRLTATEELELGVSSAELLRIESIRTTLVEQRVGREIAEAAERGVAAVAMPAPGSLKEPAERTLAAAATLTVGGLREATRAGQHAREMLVQSNLRLVGWVANRYAGGKHGLSLEDLVQEGTVGLMKGAERYDPSRGYRFSTYAMHWVRASVHRAVMMQGRTIRLPVKLQELNNQIMRGRGELELQLGREPEEEALALHLGITVQRIRDVMRWTLDSVSLETVVDSVKSQAAGRPLRLADSVEGGDDDAGEPRCGSAERVEGDVERDLLRTELENLLDTLLPVRPPSLISLSSHQVVERSHSHTRPLLTPCRSVRVWMMFGCSVSGTSCACGTDWTTRHPSRARRCRGCWVCPRKPSSSTRRAVSRSCATRSAPPT